MDTRYSEDAERALEDIKEGLSVILDKREVIIIESPPIKPIKIECIIADHSDIYAILDEEKER